MRSRSGRGAADSEYGWELKRIPGARNRHRKNCPASAPIRCSLRPPISTDTIPGVSSMTASTRMRWRRFSRIGVRIRYHRTSAVTVPYSAYQAVLAAGSTAKSLPVVIWCQNVRNTAAYVIRCTWYQVSYGIRRMHPARGDQPDEDQQAGADGRLAHVRQLVDGVDRLLDDVAEGLVGLQRVPPHDEEHVRHHQAERVPAAHRVPARHPVGADPPLQRGHPRHLQDDQGHQVVGQQSGDPARVEDAAVVVRDGRGVGPPQPQHARRARPHGDQQRDGGGAARADAAHRLAAGGTSACDRGGHGSSGGLDPWPTDTCRDDGVFSAPPGSQARRIQRGLE